MNLFIFQWKNIEENHNLRRERSEPRDGSAAAPNTRGASEASPETVLPNTPGASEASPETVVPITRGASEASAETVVPILRLKRRGWININ